MSETWHRLDLVKAQRDQLRDRVEELEDEVEFLRSRVAELEDDCLDLTAALADARMIAAARERHPSSRESDV